MLLLKGEFKNKKREGKGVYYYPDGAKYEGNIEKKFLRSKLLSIYNSLLIEFNENNMLL